jgi:hypothetical protein
LTDRAIGVKQAFAQFVQRRAAPEDEIVAELDLREEQPMSCGEGDWKVCRVRSRIYDVSRAHHS